MFESIIRQNSSFDPGWKQSAFFSSHHSLTCLSLSIRSFLVPDFDIRLFSNSSFRSTTRREERGLPLIKMSMICDGTQTTVVSKLDSREKWSLETSKPPTEKLTSRRPMFSPPNVFSSLGNSVYFLHSRLTDLMVAL